MVSIARCSKVSVLSFLIVAASAFDQMTSDMVDVRRATAMEEPWGQRSLLQRSAYTSTVGGSAGYREDDLRNSYQGSLGHLEYKSPDVLANFNEEERMVSQGFADAQEKLRWAQEQLQHIASHGKEERVGASSDFDMPLGRYKAHEYMTAPREPLSLVETSVQQGMVSYGQHEYMAAPREHLSLAETSVQQGTAPYVAVGRPSLKQEERMSSFDIASTNGFFLVENSFCSPRCQSGHGACARTAGRLLAAHSCVCIQPYTGPSCAEIQSFAEPVALPQTNMEMGRQRNPGFAALLLEPLLFGYSAFSYAFFIFCTAVSSAACMQLSKLLPPDQNVAIQGAVRNDAPTPFNVAQRSRLSAFFQYPGADLNQHCTPTPDSAEHADEDGRRYKSRPQQEIWRPVAKKDTLGKFGYVDDESDFEFAEDGLHGVVN